MSKGSTRRNEDTARVNANWDLAFGSKVKNFSLESINDVSLRTREHESHIMLEAFKSYVDDKYASDYKTQIRTNNAWPFPVSKYEFQIKSELTAEQKQEFFVI